MLPPPNEHPLEELDLSVRTYNRLKNAGITTIETLVSTPLSELAKIGGIGGVYLDGFLEEMKNNGIELHC